VQNLRATIRLLGPAEKFLTNLNVGRALLDGVNSQVLDSLQNVLEDLQNSLNDVLHSTDVVES
jgi:hypothetical protein